MGQMVVRNIPDDVLDRFRKVAKKAGKSAEQLAREAIEKEAGTARDKVIAEIIRVRKLTKPVDVETSQRIMDEARAERDARPYVYGLDDDR